MGDCPDGDNNYRWGNPSVAQGATRRGRCTVPVLTTSWIKLIPRAEHIGSGERGTAYILNGG